MRSLHSRLVELVLHATGAKRRYATGENLRESVRRDRAAGTLLPAYPEHAGIDVSVDTARGRPVCRLKPRGVEPARHVLHFHGGGYVHGVTKHHWKFLGRLARQAPCAVTAPLYPLGPEQTARETFEFALGVYEDLLKRVKPSDLTVSGDSAGAGLALSLAHQLREGRLALPARLILISPWLDVELAHPEIPAYERKDRMISAPGAREGGKWYAGDLDVRDPRVSPIHAPLAGLPPITLFIGTHEIFLPDARKFKGLAERARAELDYHEYPGMFHDWAVTDVPEAKQAFETILAAVRG